MTAHSHKAMLRRFSPWIVWSLLSAVCCPPKVQPSDETLTRHITLSEESPQWVERTLGQASLAEKIGQMLQVRYYADYADFEGLEYRHVRDELAKYRIGSVLVGMRFDKLGPQRPLALRAATVANQLQHDSKLPLLFAADLERGVATRLEGVPSFPWPMAFGAVAKPRQVEHFAAITAREARAVGIHWALAPVSDVNSNPANPVINDRSFGEDAVQVSAMVAAFIRGARANGLLVTAKHFPGNGDTAVDAHRAVASIDADLKHLHKIEFLPFQAAISAGVDAVMLAHAKVPALEPDSNKITTVSSNIITGVLRGELGFKGVVVTDALEMRGITTLYDSSKGSPTARAAVDAIKAGCDVIMIPTDLDGAFHAIINAVNTGEIPESRIDQSVRKILAMKAALGLDKNRFVEVDRVPSLTSKPEDLAFAQHVADEAVTLVRANSNLLPLRKGDFPFVASEASTARKRLLLIILAEALEAGNGVELEREIRERRSDVAVFRFDGRFSGAAIPQLLQEASNAGQIILATYLNHNASRQSKTSAGDEVTYFGLRGLSGEVFKQIVTKYSEKTAVIALGSPYLIENFPQIQTYICTYAMAPTSEVSAVKALFGEIQNHAKLPVTLPGIAPRGFSLSWPNARYQEHVESSSH